MLENLESTAVREFRTRLHEARRKLAIKTAAISIAIPLGLAVYIRQLPSVLPTAPIDQMIKRFYRDEGWRELIKAIYNVEDREVDKMMWQTIWSMRNPVSYVRSIYSDLVEEMLQ